MLRHFLCESHVRDSLQNAPKGRKLAKKLKIKNKQFK